MFGYFGKLLEQ